MTETRKLAAILAADVVGYSRLTGADEDRTLARLRALRSDLIDPTIAVHHGRVVKRTGDGLIVEFRSVVDAVRCAVEVQRGVAERNAGVSPDRRIEFRVGVHLGDVVEEADGDLMGDGVNIAARIESICEAGGLCLSEDAYRQVRDRANEAFVDLGEKVLKNIARPVRLYALKAGPADAAQAPAPPAPERSGPPRLSIVVLPFANMGGDASQEYFVDGVTESLTTDLSRVRGMLVIGRNTAFTFKGKAVDLKRIGRELNVRYVLEGSVQRTGNRMRVNVQLVDAETGNHLWAERFDKPLADLFDMQDEIVARLANAINAQLVTAEARRAERAPNPDSMDLYFQGMASFNKGSTPEDLAQARRFYERALALDPGNLDALVGTARIDALMAAAYYVAIERLAAAEETITKALSLEPADAFAHLVSGYVQTFTNRAAVGIAEYEKALSLNPNMAGAHALIGLAKILVGRPEDAEGHVGQALRLSPLDTQAYNWYRFVGMAKLCLGADEEAVVWYRKSIETNRNAPFAHFGLAAALAHLGRTEEARSAARAGLALDPNFTLSRYRATVLIDSPTYQALRERVAEGLRKAGIPEG